MIQLTVQGARELQDRMAAATAGLPHDVRQAMQWSLMWLEADMRANAPRDTGQLANSVTHGISGTGAELIGTVGATAAYWPFVENRTRPHWPPIAAITPWARRHGIPPFLVARAIARHGTRAQPFIRPAWQRNQQRIREVFAQLGARIVARLVTR